MHERKLRSNVIDKSLFESRIIVEISSVYLVIALWFVNKTIVLFSVTFIVSLTLPVKSFQLYEFVRSMKVETLDA